MVPVPAPPGAASCGRRVAESPWQRRSRGQGDGAIAEAVADARSRVRSRRVDSAAAASPAAQPSPREAARRLFLERSAVTLGQTWAEEWRANLRREGRPAAGGWPGTLREARVRVERFLLSRDVAPQDGRRHRGRSRKSAFRFSLSGPWQE